jgi:CheY-like chemotaxis protein
MPTIIAAVDDLLFSSKIRNVARRLGVDVSFARSLDAVLEGVRAGPPALILFDLDADRIRPIEALSALRAEPAGAGVPTLGFVSHVHADVIAAARHAGIDTVMARSQFVASLPDILAGAR